MQAIFQKLKGDKVIWMVTIFLALYSLLAVYSATGALAEKYDTSSVKYLFKHLIMLGSGIAVIYWVHQMKFKYFSRISQILIWVAAGLLLVTLVFGLNINGASRWIKIPIINQNFQTSDFAKIILIMYVARMLTLKRTKLHSFKEGVLPILIPVGVICLLIFPANFSTAFLLGIVCIILMYIGGVHIKHISAILGTAILGLVLMFTVYKINPDLVPERMGTWMARINSFVIGQEAENASSSYQVEEAKAAIFRGGIFPSPPGTAHARNSMPHAYSDMIYAFIIEEYGSLFGGLGILMLYLIFFYRSIRIAMKCPRHFGGLLALGLSMLLVFQAFINMAVSVNIIPVTGQPLPLVSMGGTSILFTCFAIGVILSVSRSVYDEDYELESSAEEKLANPVKKKKTQANTKTEEEHVFA
ncbi:MAG: FtsW/RodA/SpoVE family cell cycle protein [Flavobacteriales bacterium]